MDDYYNLLKSSSGSRRTFNTALALHRGFLQSFLCVTNLFRVALVFQAGVLVKNIAIVTVGHEFDYRAGQIGHQRFSS